MANDDLTLIAFALAIVLAGITFLLVRHFSDEFERAYTGAPAKRLIRLPLRVIATLIACVVALISLR